MCNSVASAYGRSLIFKTFATPTSCALGSSCFKKFKNNKTIANKARCDWASPCRLIQSTVSCTFLRFLNVFPTFFRTESFPPSTPLNFIPWVACSTTSSFAVSFCGGQNICNQAIGILVTFFALQYPKNGSIRQNRFGVRPCIPKLTTSLVQDNPRGWNPVEAVLPPFPCQKLMYSIRQLTTCNGAP
ncbi:hypothetical protein BGW80DRAFT_599561 [Lactifluus volemus]|nr:hypothetical protein BGW80DRAFT_599561 [Lactifluus volemus]